MFFYFGNLFVGGGGGELFFCKKGYIYSIYIDYYYDIYFNIMVLLFINKYKYYLVYL